RAPRLRRPSVPALRTALAFGGAVFRRCGRLLGVSSRLQPLRGLQRPAAGTGMHFYVSHRPSIQHGRPTPSHRPALALARCSAPADFASLRVLGAPAASRPPTLASSLVALPASLGLLRAASRTARALRAPPWNQGEPFGKWHNRRKQHYPKASLWHQREVARRSRD